MTYYKGLKLLFDSSFLWESRTIPTSLLMPWQFTCWSHTPSYPHLTLKYCTWISSQSAGTCFKLKGHGRVSCPQTWRVLTLFSAPSHLVANCLSMHWMSRSNEANRATSLEKKYTCNPEVIQPDTFHSLAAFKNHQQKWLQDKNLQSSMPMTQHLLKL